ncbi:SPOR domain-containing protein [Pontibacter saemangeumensis]|uniref:SPOR domain-containing protein n=1 Tax=Pontibacter saemangeumensis TaxID=1084525 RepID=A0ABP8LEQ2_9BACT
MVEKHIKSLLYDHDCVIIPEFGGLITRYVSAKINPVKHAFAPPSKKIAFNEKLVLNDGLLISTIAYHNNISLEEAQQLVASFVHQAKTHLQTDKRYDLSGIGVFRYSQEHKIEFEYVEGDNLLEASFGLPELVARPVRVEEPAVLRALIKERQQEHQLQRQPLRKRLKRAYNVAAGLALAGLTGTALYFLSLQADYNISSLNPVSLFNSSYAAGTDAAANRYAADFVPFTQDEKHSTYISILPGAATVAADEDIENEASPAGTVTDASESSALDESAYNAVNQQVNSSEEVSDEVVKPKEEVLTINAKTGRSYIIIGGYSTSGNAEVRREAVRKEGYDSKMLLPGQNAKLYRVSIADFATPDEAKAALKSYRKSFGETIWVLNY